MYVDPIFATADTWALTMVSLQDGYYDSTGTASTSKQVSTLSLTRPNLFLQAIIIIMAMAG